MPPMLNSCHVRLFGWFDEPRCLIEGGLAYCVRLLSFTPERRRLDFDSEWQLPGEAAYCRSRPVAVTGQGRLCGLSTLNSTAGSVIKVRAQGQQHQGVCAGMRAIDVLTSPGTMSVIIEFDGLMI